MHATWEPIELSLEAADRYENPYADAALWATFEHESGTTYEVPGFWDGGDTWRVRFSPPEAGEWTWTARGDDEGLSGVGAFGVSPAGGAGRLREHGFLVADGRELRHADGEPFFWLGDTVWSAGAKASPGEWARYLDRRADQGFTATQVNALPQHDASTPQNRLPFVDWELDRPDPAYFRALDALVETCHDRGVVPALVALWHDYVAGENPDWDTADGTRHPFGPDGARRYGRYIGARYGAYGAAWLLSGDATFADGTLPVYDALAEGVDEAVTHPLRTVHMPGGQITPEEIVERDWLDFHLYQSSHVSDLERPARQAEETRAMGDGRPVVNGEPPYEGHGLFDDGGERITRQLARRAAWISVLAGANAGVTYGGHGLWQWHRRGETNVQAAGKGRPDPWDEALSLAGARDYAALRTLLERFDYGSLAPRQDLLATDDPTVRAAATDEAVLVYVPDASGVTLSGDDALGERSTEWVHPATRETAPAERDGAEVAAAPWMDDALLVAR